MGYYEVKNKTIKLDGNQLFNNKNVKHYIIFSEKWYVVTKKIILLFVYKIYP